MAPRPKCLVVTRPTAAGAPLVSPIAEGPLGAAWIFIVVYVIGNRIASDYGVSVLTTVSLLSLFVLAATYSAKMDKGGLATWYPWAARTATWAIFILVALDLLNGLAHDFFGSFYETTMYIAAAVGAVGAYMQSQGN